MYTYFALSIQRKIYKNDRKTNTRIIQGTKKKKFFLTPIPERINFYLNISQKYLSLLKESTNNLSINTRCSNNNASIGKN